MQRRGQLGAWSCPVAVFVRCEEHGVRKFVRYQEGGVRKFVSSVCAVSGTTNWFEEPPWGDYRDTSLIRKRPPLRTSQGPRHTPTVGSYEEALSYERGNVGLCLGP